MCRHATRAIGALLLTFSSATLLAQEHSAASATPAVRCRLLTTGRADPRYTRIGMST